MSDSVLVLGDVNVDIIGKFDGFPSPGDSVYSDNPVLRSGGSGLNTFVGLKKLGVEAEFATMVGKDLFADFIKKDLSEMGIEFNPKVSPSYPTGVVFSLSVGNERTFFSFRKNAADIHITEADLAEITDNASTLYLTGISIVEGIETFETFLEVVKRVKTSGARVFFDPNMRKIDPVSISRIEHLIPYVDVFLPARDELSVLLSKSSKFRFCSELLEAGVTDIWVKKGAKGCSLISRERGFDFPAPRAKVLDCTGAGDAFNAAVVWGYLNGLDVKETGIYANVYAAISTERLGAATSYPDKECMLKSGYYKSIKTGVKVS
jgi:sugar/nucleoside kinase (ribokinase family)